MYDRTPHAYVLLSQDDLANSDILDMKQLTLGRVKAMQDMNLVDGNRKVMIVDAILHN